MEFLMSPEASEIDAKHFVIPIRPEVKGAPGTQPIDKIKVIRPTVAEIDKGVPEVIEDWRDTFGN
jgi:iron(III) transport system substrate-binding protein